MESLAALERWSNRDLDDVLAETYDYDPDLSLDENLEFDSGPYDASAAIAALTSDLSTPTQKQEVPPPPPAETTEPSLIDGLLDFLLPSPSDMLEQRSPLTIDIPGAATPTSARPSAEDNPKVWYLGIDIGTTGISAVLLNRETCQLYPLYWLEIKLSDPVQGTIAPPEKTSRLPAAVYLSAFEHSGKVAPTAPVATVAIASLAPHASTAPDSLPLRDYKPYLRVGIPHYSPSTSQWEPVIQGSDTQQIPLSIMHQALRTLLATFTCSLPIQATHTPTLTCGAVGLEDEAFQVALQQLSAVIVGYPANWSDTYSFNVREAVLAAGLVARPDQVYLIEDAIATLLSGLPSADGRPITMPHNLTQTPDLHGASWRGGTLILNAGASVSDLALVNLPSPLSHLTYQDFTFRSVAYGGNAIEQDIICQLIHPAWVRQVQLAQTEPSQPVSAEGTWHWQPDSHHPDRDPWESLGWDNLTPPAVGEPDPIHRTLLQQRLTQSPLGLALLEAARHIKYQLQQQDRLTLRFGNHALTLVRQDFGSRVLLPYIQRLNRELNTLLNQTSTSVLEINQVICSGGTASLAAIARWLRQKLPNATIIQDTYAPPTSLQDNCLPACSRVAYGLATVPLHPQILDLARHQYSDYFLLMQLLRAFPDSPITLNALLQILERRDINTQSCQQHILALLEGHLPPGLVPVERDSYLLTPASQQNFDYQLLLSAPLFVRQDVQTYLPNHQQWQHFRRYLDTLLASAHQKLNEPLSISAISLPVP